MNLPNQLTLSRLVFTGFFLAAVMWRARYNDSIALAFFIVASITDYLDGRIARRRQLITNFGILMDPLADKVLICSAFIAFVGRDLIPAWMVVVIVARELAITGLRLLAASKQVVLAAEGYGKHKTISQMAAIIALLVQESYPEWGSWGAWLFAGWLPAVAELSKWIAVALTILSGTFYLWRNRQIYLSDF
jgi:CDP-diacylglycerol--glycerol-3-phosphate 3-phosphatidyltransferase